MFPARVLASAGVVLLCATSAAQAQESRPVPKIVPTAPERPSQPAATTATRVEILSRSTTDGSAGVLHGEVTDLNGTKLTAARVVLLNTPWQGSVDPAAGFRYAALPPAIYQVEIRQLGYQPARFPLEIAGGEVVRMRVALAPQPIALEEVEVTTQRPVDRSRMADFYERRERGRGRFLTHAEIVKRPERELNDILATLPRVHLVMVNGRNEIRLRGERPSPPRVRSRARAVRLYGGRVFTAPHPEMKGGSGETNTDLAEGDCPPLYFLDGMSFDPTLGDVPEHVKPAEVEGIEIYQSREVPVKFRLRGAECGAVLIWTRNPWNF